MATTPIKLKRSNTISVIPDTSDLIEGEVALNTVDKKFYVRDGSSQVITLSNHYATDYDVNVVTFKVTVATSTSAHPYHGTGSSNKYKINGVFSPYLKLIPRITYRFDQSDSSNSTHPLRFYYDSAKATAFTTGVTTNGTPGSAGAYTQIIVSDTTPPVLHYQCSAHANMGWAVTTSTRNFTGFDTDDLSEGSTNLYHTTTRVNSAIDSRVTQSFVNNLNVTAASATGNAATATALETARNIHGVSFDGTGNIDLTEVIQDTVGAMFSSNTETNITATYEDSDGTIDLVATTTSNAADDISTGDAAVTIATTSGNITIDAQGSNTDILFKGTDGSSDITALQLDMSTAGNALFNNAIQHNNYIWNKTDGAISYFGANFEVRLTHQHNTGLRLTNLGTGTPAVELQFVDSNEAIGSDGTNLLLTSGGTEFKLPNADGNAGQVLKTDASGNLAFASVSSLAGAGIQNVSDDSSPQLGANLDVVTHSIVSTSNRDINLTPNGSGKVVVGTNGIEFGDGTTQTSAGATTGFSIAMATALG